jgi:hypothetical protein
MGSSLRGAFYVYAAIEKTRSNLHLRILFRGRFDQHSELRRDLKDDSVSAGATITSRAVEVTVLVDT